MSELPKLTIIDSDECVQSLPVEIPEGAYPEAPIWVLHVDGLPRCYITTGHTMTYDITRDKNIRRDLDALDGSTGKCVVIRNIQAQGYPESAEVDHETYWRQMYYGVFSAHLISHPYTGESCVFAVLHGENKNECLAATDERPIRYYDNSVLPAQAYTLDQYSGYCGDGGEYRDYWEAYFGFVSMAYSPLSEDRGGNMLAHDLGPIVWPSTGYINGHETQASRGLRHPSSIVHKGHIYVFYLEESPAGYETGLGVKVARARLDDLLTPNAFRTYFEGEFQDTALPEGFVKEDKRFLSMPGGRSSNILDCFGVSRFSAARIAGTPYFMGVESYQHPASPDCEIRLRLSSDLVRWGEPVAVPGTRMPAGTGIGWYPILADEEYTDNTVIQAHSFLIAGTQMRCRDVSTLIEPLNSYRRNALSHEGGSRR